jgi:hypothetical protein
VIRRSCLAVICTGFARGFRQRYNVEVVQEDPEHLLGDIGHLLTPEFVGSWDMHSQDEGYWPIGFGFGGLSEVCEDFACALLKLEGRVAQWG